MNKVLFTLKSLLYQGNWNYQNMHGSGFSYLFQYAVKSENLKLDEAEFKKSMDYFNTHPFFITFIIGIMIKEYKKDLNPNYPKKIYGPAFAALGDVFYWHSLRASLFVIAALVGLSNPYLGVITYLLSFNIFHFLFLYNGYDIGLFYGRHTIDWFNRIKFARWSVYMEYMAIFLLGLFVSLLCKKIFIINKINFIIFVLFLSIGLIAGKSLKISFSFCFGLIITGILFYFKGVF